MPRQRLNPLLVTMLGVMAVLITLFAAFGCSIPQARQDVADASAVVAQATEVVAALRADIAATEATEKADAVLGDIQSTIDAVGTQLGVLDARLEAAENVPDVLDAVGATARDTGLPYSGVVALGLGLVASIMRNVQHKRTIKSIVQSVQPVMDESEGAERDKTRALQDASGVAGAVDVARGKRRGLPI